MKKGIFLLCFGKRGYAFSAYNLAYSIKHFNPDLPICLVHDGCIKWLNGEQQKVFDIKIDLPNELKFGLHGSVDPARIKTGIYDLLPFDQNLFLDVDAIALQDLEPIFDILEKEGGYYYTHVQDTHTIDQGRIIKHSIWAYADDIWGKYELSQDAVYPCINSSFQYIKKCKESKELFEQVNSNMNSPIALHQLRTQWGGSQPDELYMGIAMAQKGITGKMPKDYILFGYSTDSRTLSQIQSDYYILSTFGGRGFTKPKYTQFYDDLLIKMHRKDGKNHTLKHYIIIGDKHANTRTTQTKKQSILPSLIPLSKSVLIKSENLIQEYQIRGQKFKVTNWLNCSFVEFKGKVYFAYRMEGSPFCQYTKIGLCLLDENYQPIKDSNVLLDLHSELNGYLKGFHVEDPRLFIYRDELYLSYTDGYQMAQAKINPDTLQASESFYIEKPFKLKTEKNWTFFEHENKLFSIYTIAPHRVFEMNGKDAVQKESVHFKNVWKWGELRGGTSPIKMADGNYLSFFHSAIDFPNRGTIARQYFMGAYIFEGKHPFKPLSISKEPLMAGGLVAVNTPRLSSKIFVIFPCGVIRKENSSVVSFGYNDYQCRFVEIEDSFLKENMIAIEYKEEEVNA